MADNEVCAGCLRDNEEEIAVLWCNDCEEPVCRPCGKAHRRFAIPHDVIDIKDISNVSKTMSKICKEHAGQKLIFFCVNHDKILCPACLSELHQECDINHIEKAAKGIKDSSAIHDLKERIHNQKGVIEKVKEEYNGLSSKIGHDKKQQHERLKQLRSTIEDRLNQLDKNIDTHYNQSVEKISSNTEQLTSLAQTTQANLQDIEKAETEESEVNLFHLVKHLDTSQLSDEENLQFLGNDISNMSLQFIPENFIEKVDAMLNEFGNYDQTTSLKSQQSGTRTRQSQLRVHLDEQQILNQTRIFHAGESTKFYACCFSDDNKVGVIEEQSVIDDHSGPFSFTTETIYLRIINPKDCKSRAFKLDRKYNFICKDTICWFDRNNILIVENNYVHVIDLELEDIYRTIKVIHFNGSLATCKWITCIESQILVFCDDKWISWIDYNGKSVKRVEFEKDVYDLDIFDNKVYCTFKNLNDIKYTTFTNATQTCYTSLDLRKSCRIAAGDNLIFLMEKERNTIYRIDLKTKQRSTFHKDEITNPTHIHLNNKTKELAVTFDEGNSLKIFSVGM
ncbi:uncharacterized protein LOC127717433 [Mytilus californianus]|uniref:uncharacterized protein LOC127717433 n=1 Tax=Mytilus californianus TaxID=6549 RepID=UPI0022465A51|nr:uncharacterized protein LOC127717433 [Mytilus californianus]